MSAVRRIVAGLLLVCVSLALGDAPYVDEYLEAVGVAPGTSEAGGSSHHDEIAPGTASIKICQNLLVLSCSSDGSLQRAVRDARSFPRAGAVPYSSIVPRRIDRPPSLSSLA